MAANIEQIFQDFILNKIREIEDQNEDKSAADRVGGASEMDGAEKNISEREKCDDDFRRGGSQKKHKKHKKHKSKRKRRNRDRKESSTESGSELEKGTKRHPRKGTPTKAKKVKGDLDLDCKPRCHKQHSTGKRRKKKKKRRRKNEEYSSESDSTFASKRRDGGHGQSVSLRCQEELPDIIPKQDSKGRGDEERHGRISCHSPLHSYSQSHSCSVKRNSHSRSRHDHQRSRTRSLSCPRFDMLTGSSSEKKENLDETRQPVPCPSKYVHSPPLPLDCTRRNSQADDQTQSRIAELESPVQSGKPTEEREKTAEKPESESSKSFAATVTSPAKKKRKQSPQSNKEGKTSVKEKRSKSPRRTYKKRLRSKSPSVKKRSRSRSGGRKSRRSRSQSGSRSRRRVTYSQRDRWKREPSHSPVLILRKNRSPSRKHCSSSNSPQRISELDKDQLLEIAKANAAAMCAKVGMPIPASLRSAVLPLVLPRMAMNAAMASMTAATVTAALSNMGTLSSLLPLPSITNKPPLVPTQPSFAALEEVKKKVAKQVKTIGIKEFTDKCQMIVDSTAELPVAEPHVSDEEDNGKPFGGSALREQKVISFSINNTTVRPALRSDAGMAKEFPVSSGSQHRKKEGEGLGAYGEWVPVDKTKYKSAAVSRTVLTNVSIATASLSSVEAGAGPTEDLEQPVVTDNDSVFPETSVQPVDITHAVTERIKAQRRLAENPYDINAICMLSRAQEQVDAWAQSNTVPGLFTGSTGAQVLSSEELSTSGPQAWLKKDQFMKASPVSGGVGEFLMRKMGWRTGEGLGRNREGTVEPIVIDFKVDRKGLVAEGEKPQKQTGGLVVTKDLMGKHPVSALIELCNKKRIMQPDFVMVHHSGPDHRKNFLFKVTVNGMDYQPHTSSPNKKHAKAMAATVALQALGEVPVDGPGLYTGPVFTAASTGPLFST
ncbi:protein SON isoform X2 [Mugil cephalus]|uniref:protein SON isoform X2 n=1 Tax=Mugil cephalus TaxID=48193 RepID=UPI001FB62965|nr:protein SON isoform X2 [Mugil cephalus]